MSASTLRHSLRHPLHRCLLRALTCLLLGLGAAVGLAGPAHAEDGYRYWNYSHLEGDSWVFAQVGPADYQPEDGAVEGFRFGTSTVSQGLEPRADLDQVTFEAVCGATEAEADRKRVAVLIDYGTEEEAGSPPEPRAACAVGPTDASTLQLLHQVAEVRTDSGMTCALDGYPATGCGDPVPDATVPTDEEPVAFSLPGPAGEEEGTAQGSVDSEAAEVPWTLVGVAGIVLLVAAGAVVMARRNRAV